MQGCGLCLETVSRCGMTNYQTWSSRDLSLGLGLGLEPQSLGLGLGLGTLESRSRSWSWDLGPWRLGLRHSLSVKLRQNSKSYVKLQRYNTVLPKHLDIAVT